MNERFNKTSICSVVFLDIVGYSEQPVSQQIQLKERFKTLLGVVLKGVAQDDRIMLDTGDGAAIALLGAPEEALFVALAIHDGILKDNQHHGDALLVRIGVNLGPVRVVTDINGHLNILGDGINVAQRVMSFAEPNQILVSRTYYEVVSRISNETTGLFSYSGIKTDKHVREHEVYAIRTMDGEAASQAAAVVAQRQASHQNLMAVAGALLLAGAVVVWLLWAKGHHQPASMPVSTAPVAPLAAAPKTETSAKRETTPDVTPTPVSASAPKPAKTTKPNKVAKPAPQASPTENAQPAGNGPQKPEQEKQAQQGSSGKSGWDKFKQSVHQGQKAPCSDAERALNQCK